MKKTIRDYDLKGQRVIIRCDFNVPIENGVITDNTRIVSSLKTINYAVDHNAKIVLLSHLGKIKKEKDKKDNSLLIVKEELERLLNREVLFSVNTRGKELENIADNLKEKEILLIENTRYEDVRYNLESICDVELAKYWSTFGDIFINDAFGTIHRKHASNYGIPLFIPSGIGFLVEEEVSKLDSIINDNTHPFILIMGGKKVSDKIPIIKNLIDKCDMLLIGGAMAFTFLKAKDYNVGKSIVDEESLDFCQEMLAKYKDKIILPVDIVCEKENKLVSEIKDDDIGYDIGSKTIDLYVTKLKGSKRVIINGPMGMFEEEKYANGTREIYKYLESSNIKTLVGGGDSAYAVKKLGFDGKFYHVSTGGGATLEYLSGVEIPALSVITDA